MFQNLLTNFNSVFDILHKNVYAKSNLNYEHMKLLLCYSNFTFLFYLKRLTINFLA